MNHHTERESVLFFGSLTRPQTLPSLRLGSPAVLKFFLKTAVEPSRKKSG